MTKKTLINKASRIRVDFFLSTSISDLSRARVQDLVSDGLIEVNNKPCKKKSQILEIGDMIQIQIPEPEKTEPNKHLKLDIIFEDQNLMIINKPAGLLVHPTNSEKQNTVSNILLYTHPKIKFGQRDRKGIVHRLDRETSGILVIPKDKEIFQEIQKLFKDNQIKKTYIAVVIDKPKSNEFNISTRQKRSTKDPTKNIVVHTDEGRSAQTKVKVLKTKKLKNQTISILELKPKTGRMHQLRLQLSYLNLPILGDSKYGNKLSQSFSKKLGIERQLLHAYKIEFTLGNKKYKATARIPKDIKQFLSANNK
ncbi:MAG: RluA family pseudouridine synthase [bacterium]